MWNTYFVKRLQEIDFHTFSKNNDFYNLPVGKASANCNVKFDSPSSRYALCK